MRSSYAWGILPNSCMRCRRPPSPFGSLILGILSLGSLCLGWCCSSLAAVAAAAGGVLPNDILSARRLGIIWRCDLGGAGGAGCCCDLGVGGDGKRGCGCGKVGLSSSSSGIILMRGRLGLAPMIGTSLSTTTEVDLRWRLTKSSPPFPFSPPFPSMIAIKLWIFAIEICRFDLHFAYS